CITDQNGPAGNCDWRSLPLPSTFRAPSRSSTHILLYWRTADGTVLFGGLPMTSNELAFGKSTLPESKSDWPTALASDSVSESQIDECLCRIDELDVISGLALANIRQAVMTDEKRGKLSQALNLILDDATESTPEMSPSDVQKVFW